MTCFSGFRVHLACRPTTYIRPQSQLQCDKNSMRVSHLNSLFAKTLTLQTTLKTCSRTPYFQRAMSSASPSPNADQSRILDFWFAPPLPAPKWFSSTPALDAEIRTSFLPLIENARSSSLPTWKETPLGTLALLLLLDQFTRNIYRNTPNMCCGDTLALSIASEAVAKGFDRKVSDFQAGFFYLPFMHAESLVVQNAGVALYEGMINRTAEGSAERNFAVQSMHFAEKHRDCILKFGRFPSRNAVMDLQSTEAEKKHLEENPGGF